jgi:hypothetical protein
MKKIMFYMKAQWLGELPFNISYFLNLYFVTLTYRFATYFAIPALGWDDGRVNKFVIMWVVLLGVYLMVWGAVGATRAAKKINPQSRGLAAVFGFILIFNTLKYYFALFGGGMVAKW